MQSLSVAESKRIREKYPGTIPIYLRHESKSRHTALQLPPLEKNKYLPPKDMTIGQFIDFIRTRMKLTRSQAVFFFIYPKPPEAPFLATPSQTLAQAFHLYRNAKDFLEMTISTEDAFG